MYSIPKTTNKKRPNVFKKFTTPVTEDTLRHLAFDNSLQANIISIVSTGKIIMANNAACKLLGYSKKALLTKKRPAVFDINESAFKNNRSQEKPGEGRILFFEDLCGRSFDLVRRAREPRTSPNLYRGPILRRW